MNNLNLLIQVKSSLIQTSIANCNLLWNLHGEGAGMLYAYWVNLKFVWILPRHTHSYFIYALLASGIMCQGQTNDMASKLLTLIILGFRPFWCWL